MQLSARRSWRVVAYLSVLAIVCAASPAFGHAALTSSDPEKGARLDSAPTEVTVSYAEPPTTNSEFAVLDGCDRDVTDSIDILNDTISATVREGQSGTWTVEWSVVSAVDGHLTRDKVSFRVAGEADCSAVAGDEGPADRTGSESSLPIVPIGIATAVILGIAVAIRLRSNRTQP